MPQFIRFTLTFLAVSACLSAPARAQRVMERLDRGVVAIHQADGRVWVSWRLLASDPADVAFNVYRFTSGAPDGEEIGAYGARQTADAGMVKVNAAPLSGPTWCIDERPHLARETRYEVRAVIGGQERPAEGGFTLAANAPPLPYLNIPLQTPAGYMPNDASAADLDGDGRYEIILHQAGVGRDNSQAGMTDPPVFQAYTLEGKLLWTIHLGRNIREGAHYTQFIVYDLDGDGRAEFACKTADGSIDGLGRVIGDPHADWVEKGPATVPTADRTGAVTDAEGRLRARLEGRILRGPEYLTVFDGLTGAARATVPYVPPRHPDTDHPTAEQMKELWGDAYGNRMDRFLAGVAYLDGRMPSLIMCRGYYTRSVLVAWDFRDGMLAQRWIFDSHASAENRKYAGQGFHSLSVADVDGDGRDEIIYGACVIDDDGRGLYSTGWGHGDALHVSDLVPSRPGLEVLGIQERFDRQGINMREAATGRPIFLVPSVRAAESGDDKGEGPGRGVAFNIDPRYPGSEVWAVGAGMTGMYSATGELIGDRRPRSCNFAVWWDGDLLRELLDRNVITKWNWRDGTESVLLIAQGCSSNNGTKATPALSADLLGDWREEVLLRTNDGHALRLYTTTIPTRHRLVTLMQDPQYRLAIAWQNVAYNQPPHPSFALDEPAP